MFYEYRPWSALWQGKENILFALDSGLALELQALIEYVKP